MTRRGAVARWTSFVAGLVASLVVMEAALAVIEWTPLWRVLPVVPQILGEPDPDTGFAFTPGASGVWTREHRARVSIDALGLRDDEMSLAKPPGTIRVGLLGDSMTEALQVAHQCTFEALAERRLRARGVPVEIANLAMSGNGPLRQLVRLEKVGYPLHLDLVVALADATDFLTGELLDDSVTPGYVIRPDGSVVRGYAFRRRFSQRYVDTPVGRLFIAAYQHSRVFRMLYLRVKDPVRRMLGLPEPRARARSASVPTPCASGRVLRRLLHLWRDHEPRNLWLATETLFDELARDAAAREVPVAYAMRAIPVPRAVCTADVASRAQLIATITSALARRGIRFVDWREALLDDARRAGETLKFGRLSGFDPAHPGSGHLNFAGHRAYAEVLAHIVLREIADGRVHVGPAPARAAAAGAARAAPPACGSR